MFSSDGTATLVLSFRSHRAGATGFQDLDFKLLEYYLLGLPERLKIVKPGVALFTKVAVVVIRGSVA